MLTLATAPTTQYATFRVDHLLLGIAVAQVREVFRYGEMTPVPLAPRAVEGLLNLRGQIVIALDLRRVLHLPSSPSATPPMNIVVEDGDGVISLLVDEIFDVLEVPVDAFTNVPENMPDSLKALIEGVCPTRQGLMLVLNVAQVLTESSL